MGTTASNLQILDVPEDAVRDALPHALVETGSKQLSPPAMTWAHDSGNIGQHLSSRQLECTLPLDATLGSDVLWLTLQQKGKRLTGHKVLPLDTCTVGDSKLFCSALELPVKQAPKLR